MAATAHGRITRLGWIDTPGSVANCAHGGTGSGSVAYRVDINEGVDRATSLVAAAAVHAVDQAGFFFDDFDNGVLSPLWTYTGAAHWSEAASRLTGNAPGATPVQAIARLAFAGCIRCTITAKLRFDQFAQGSARLYAWYLQPGTYVDLIVDEFANTWTLRQHIGGTVVAEVAVNVATVANRDYTVQRDYQGEDIRLSIDGDLAALLTPAAGTTPDGTVGFEVTSHRVAFDLIKVVTTTPGVAQPDAMFANGFEGP